MAAENVLATQITLGLLGSGFLQYLKNSSAFSFVHQNSKTVNHLILLATSAVGALGVHSAWNASQHSLMITGLDFATIAASLWIWAKQWAVQFLVHRGAFGAIATIAPESPVAKEVISPALLSGGIGKPIARMRTVSVAMLVCCMLFAGCAAQKPVTVGQVNKSVTTVIADAGTVAISAEQAYQAGKIPQTAAARTAINDLGGAYEEAKRLFSLALIAEGGYNVSTSTQIQACQPASSQGGVVPDPAACKAATQAAGTARSSVDAAQANLAASLQALTTKTAAVKALPAQ